MRRFSISTWPAACGLFFALVLAASCGGGGGQPLACSVSLNGDSILTAPNIDKPSSVLHRLRPAWSIEDRGVTGLSMHALSTGYPSPWPDGQVPRLGPQPPFAQVPRSASVIVIENGGIDALEERDLATFEAELRGAVDVIRAEGRIPVITGIVAIEPGDWFTPPRVAHRDRINAITHLVADDMGVVHAGWDTVEWLGMVETIDQIHRTQPASDRLVQRLAETLDAIAPHCARS